jgi:hypothetical protein
MRPLAKVDEAEEIRPPVKYDKPVEVTAAVRSVPDAFTCPAEST